MKRPSTIKFFSGLLNILACLIALVIILVRQDFFGKGDIYAFLFWTIPLATGIAISGQTIVHLYRPKYYLLRLLLILLSAGLISWGWVYVVYLILGPWINTFSFPIFYLWIIGNTAQLLFLDRCLPRPAERQKTSKVLIRLLLFPLTLILTVAFIFSISLLKDYLNRPEKEIYLIPDNFEGKFRVIYGEHCGVQASYENGRRVMNIPDNRLLIIQPRFQAGWVNNEYWLIDKKGKRTKLNELTDNDERLTKSPGVLMSGSGSMGGEMPDGSFSSESPLAIHFTDFIIHNNDNTSPDERQFTLVERKLDSLTTALVNKCRLADKARQKYKQ
jgi:hypothetical protein